jgi:hypothetical protein
MQMLADKLPLKEIHYKNGIDTDEECIEWHALYEDENLNTWKFDMIHIRKGSKYDGVVEKVTDAIAQQLTPELRETILQIKYDVPDEIMIQGIEIYHAVFSGQVKSYAELVEWRKTNPLTNSLDWLP